MYQRIENSSLMEFEILSRFLGVSDEVDCEEAAARPMRENETALLDSMAALIRGLTLAAEQGGGGVYRIKTGRFEKRWIAKAGTSLPDPL